jgi:hypothetical protein
MRKHRTLFAITLCAVLAITIAVLLATDDEPRYKGRSLSWWLRAYSDSSPAEAASEDFPKLTEIEHAIRAIGTNALPFLLKWIQKEPPSWHRAAHNKLPDSITEVAPAKLLIDGPGYEKATQAVVAFGVLGTNAAPAIPKLVALMTTTTSPRIAGRAIIALSGVGAPAFPYLVTALSDTNQLGRSLIPNFMRSMAADVGTNTCLPPLKTALQDQNLAVRAAASRALRVLAPDLLTNAPAQ